MEAATTAADDPEVPADCLNTGLTAGSHCSVCEAVIVAQTETPALGHEYSWIDNGDGTCTGILCNEYLTRLIEQQAQILITRREVTY